MNNMKHIWILVVALAVHLNGHGQGCSDPGICTIGTLNSGTSQDTVSGFDPDSASLEQLLQVTYVDPKLKASVSEVYGLAEQGVQIYSSVLRASWRMKERMLLNIKLPYTYTTGDLGSTQGVGDITISLQNTVYNAKNKRLAYTLGVVVPPNNSNKKDNGFALPMNYQTSLGSFNALVGVSGAYKGWAAAVGYQHSFGANGNEFSTDLIKLDTASADYELNQKRLKVQSSMKLIRGNDLFLRLERRFKWKKMGFYLGVLPIYRITPSSILLADGTRQKVVGSNGLTFNVTGGINYRINRNWFVRFNYGQPLKLRDNAADGLKRARVIILSLQYQLW